MKSAEKNFFARAFPVPESLSLSNTSVSLCDGRLSFFELKKHSWGSLPFPLVRPGTITPELLKQAAPILQSFSKSHGPYVRAVIHEGDAFVFRVVVPTVKINEIRPALESLLEENVPIPPAEAVFEYDIVSRDLVRSETTAAVSVVSQKTVDAYAELLLAGGLMAVSFETEARALTRALFSPNTTGVALILAILERHTLISIVENGAVVFSSSVDVGSRDIDQAIEKSGSEEPFNASLSVFSVIHDELSKVLIFWKTQEKKIKEFKDVSRIILSGSHSLTPSFARYISLSFKLPAEVGSIWTNVLCPEDDLPTLSRGESLDYGPVIGALLR